MISIDTETSTSDKLTEEDESLLINWIKTTLGEKKVTDVKVLPKFEKIYRYILSILSIDQLLL